MPRAKPFLFLYKGLSARAATSCRRAFGSYQNFGIYPKTSRRDGRRWCWCRFVVTCRAFVTRSGSSTAEVLSFEDGGIGASRAFLTVALEALPMIEDAKKDVACLYRLAFLLTGHRDLSIEIASDTFVSQNGGNPFFADWMRAWARRLVIAKALAAIREELAGSARRTERARLDRSAPLPRDWSLSPDTSKADVEEALLELDVFPRAAVLLSIFERAPIDDAATLLDADASLIKKAQAIGLGQFTSNLARRQRPLPAAFSPSLAFA